LAEILLFHHAYGQTQGLLDFAAELRRAGHTVHTPDLFDGRRFTEEGDLEAARALVASAEEAELFLYPGNQHYFADASLPSYDKAATALLMERVLSFLDRR
jgi:dienelactone hydrolase